MRSVVVVFATSWFIFFGVLSLLSIAAYKHECSQHGAITLCYTEEHRIFEGKKCSLAYKTVNQDGSTTTLSGPIPCKGTYQLPTDPPVTVRTR